MCEHSSLEYQFKILDSKVQKLIDLPLSCLLFQKSANCQSFASASQSINVKPQGTAEKMLQMRNFQPIPPGGINPEGEPMFLRLNIGGTGFLILIDAILRAESTGFLAKFVQLSHSARLKVMKSER